MPKPFARWIAALAGAALIGGLLPAAASASRPSTQPEIDGILAAVQRSPLLSKIPGRPFIVTQITVSTASASPLWASGVVVAAQGRGPPAGADRPAASARTPTATWTLVDFGDNFCGDAQVPRPGAAGPVQGQLRRLGRRARSPGGGYKVLGTAVAGSEHGQAHRACAARPVGNLQPASAFVEVAVEPRQGGGRHSRPSGRVLGFNWNLLSRPGGGGLIALASVGNAARSTSP